MGGVAGAFLVLGVLWVFGYQESKAAEVIVYKSPACDCCGNWISHLEKNGFTVAVENVDDMDSVKKRLGVPENLESCHTARVGGYIVEGHVPAADIRVLLKQRPAVKGISVPGMPMGAPGMEYPGQKPEKYEVLTFTQDGKSRVFSRH